jgi:signal peptidase I
MLSYFAPRHVKQGRQFLKDARKLLAYKRDLWSEAVVADFEAGMRKLDEAIGRRDKRQIEEAAGDLDKICAANLKPVTDAAWRENVEVFLVAIVVALGVRTYFLQPFTIPTGSMYPTLNGIIGYPQEKPSPNLLVRVWDKAVFGRTYVDFAAKDDEVIQEIAETSRFVFFTYTKVVTNRNTYMVHVPLATAADAFFVRPGRPLQRGEPIARGYYDTGDHVFVDKMTYNFRKPQRADVFVFNTTGLETIEHRRNPLGPSQFYIKRLAGLPGDTLRIDSPELFVNGERAREVPFQRVMSLQNRYGGYAFGTSSFKMPILRSPEETFTVPESRYFALGDNSRFSSDSRDWGSVPQRNIMGRGVFVYWPFKPHWGLIR